MVLSRSNNPKSRESYLRSVNAAGALAVPVFPGDPEVDLSNGLHGLVFTGGEDINPSLYGEAARAETGTPDDDRDKFEVSALKAAIAGGLPVLAICRGHQVVNVALGGRLDQHVEGHHGLTESDGRRSAWHEVTLGRGTLLAGIYGVKAMTTNSRHHQAVRPDTLAPGLVASAWTADGLVEGFESDSGSLLIGVQWHPERTERDERDAFNERSRLLFRYFVNAVSRNAKTGGVAANAAAG